MEVFFTVVEYAGIIAFAVAGAMVAVDNSTDLLGVIILSLVTSYGGGIMRDLFLGCTPPRFFTDYGVQIAVTIISAVCVFVFARIFSSSFINNEKRIGSITNVFDAAGLGIFAVYSVNIAYEAGHTSPLVVISMGVVASVGGGLIRDVIVGDTPFVLRKRIYILAALAGCVSCYVLLVPLAQSPILAMGVGALVTFTLRILATVFKWNLPIAIDFEKNSTDNSGGEKNA